MNNHSSLGEKIFGAANTIFLVLLSLTMVYPLYQIVISSLSSIDPVLKNKVWAFPVEFTFATWEHVLTNNGLWRALFNTVWSTAVATGLALLLSVMMAYALSKKRFMPAKIILSLVILTMILKAPMIPYFVTLRSYGLYNNPLVLVLPHLVMAYNLVILRSFFLGIPAELEESARLDGCGDFQTLFHIVLPVSKSALATIGLFYAVLIWNQFLHPKLFLRSDTWITLQLKLRSLIEIPEELYEQLLGNGKQIVGFETIQAASIIFATIPILIVYPLLQKHFVKGALLGSVKG